ncbi:ORF6N domain-containing protein [bacterium]|nr:ORF6N domain-containing protein [bacterium]
MPEKIIVPIDSIQSKIHFIRGKKVLLDQDLAELYGVETRQLKRQVKRNISRFPDDFLLVLTKEETVSLRCQFGTLEKGRHSKYLPFAFTENGVSMLSTVLQNELAIQINIQIMRTFTKLREWSVIHKDLYKHLNRVEAKQINHDKRITRIDGIIDEMLKLPVTLKKKNKPIGFRKK